MMDKAAIPKLDNKKQLQQIYSGIWHEQVVNYEWFWAYTAISLYIYANIFT